MAGDRAFNNVLRLFCQMQTLDQSTNPGHLVLSGRNLHHGWSLNLLKLGSQVFSPVFPRLEEIVLENVQIGPDTVTYLRHLAIKVVLCNVFWFQGCIKDFRQGSQLREVEVSSVHVVDFTHEADNPNFPVHRRDNDPRIAVIEHAEECHDQVWRIARDDAEALQLAAQHTLYLHVHRGQPLASTVVAPGLLAA
jgi:hypothetical protein